MAILLTGTTIGGHSAIHAGNLATHGIITTSNIGSYAMVSSGGILSGTLTIGTAGSTSQTRALRIVPTGSNPNSFGSYSGSWRSAIEIWDNGSATMLFLAPPDGNNYNYSIIKSVGAGLTIDVGSFGATNAITISTAGVVNAPQGLQVGGNSVVSTAGGQTIAGTTYFSGGESLNVYGIRGRFTNEYIHLYNKVGIGHPSGWGQGEGNTPSYGLSTYGGANFAYGNNADSTFNGIVYSTASFRAPIYYDSANTNYFGDFAGTSNLNVLYTNYLYIDGTQLTGTQTQLLKNTLDVTTLPYKVDITVNGDANTFYAVQFWGGDQDVWRRIIIKRGYGETAPWDPIGTGVHHGGLLLDWEGNFGGWGGAEYADRIRVFNESYTNVCADMFIWSHSMGYVFMLRGGGAIYHLFSDQPINGFYQAGAPDIAYSTSTLLYDDAWSGTNQYDVPAPAPLTLAQVNSSRIDGLRTKKQSLLDNRYLRQGVDISGIGTVTATNFLATNAFYLNSYNYYLNSSNGGIYTNARFETAGNLVVGGNSYLGNGNGDEVHINDILRVGATDSGDAHIFFGEGGSAGSDYGAHLYWDSGYRFTWYTRNAGTDSTLFYYDTNSLSYITWGRSLSMNTNSIDYTGQLHFSGGTRFQSIDTHYLKFKTDATDYGSIQVRDTNESVKGYLGYFDASGFGLLNSSGSWGIRLNPGNGDTILYSGGNWKLTTTSAGVSVTGNVYIDQNYGHGLVGLYSASRYQGVFAMGDAYKLSADGTSTGTLYGIAWTHTNVGGQSKSGLGHQALFMDNGNTQTAIGTGIWTNGLITTTSYGTSANWNTAYNWGNHASAGYVTSSALSSYLPLSGGTMSGSIAMGGNNITNVNQLEHGNGRIILSGNLHIDAFNGNAIYLQYYNQGVTTRIYGDIDMNNYNTTNVNIGYANNSFRAPIFYDSNDTNYYLDPNGASNLSRVLIPDAASGASLIVGTNNTSRVLNDNARKGLVVNADYYPHIYVNALSSASNSVHGAVISMTGVLSGGGYRRWGMGIANTDPSALSWGWYDNESNPHYSVGGSLGYTDTGSRMWLNTSGDLQTTGSMRAPIFYDSQDTSYYVDPNSTSNLAASYIGRVLINYDGTDTWFRMQSGNRMRITTTGGTDFIIPNTGEMSYNGNTVIHTGNIGSQSVSYATTAGSLSSMNISQFTNNSGYLTGITSGQVTGALGYTPYNSSNPSGYITSGDTTTGIFTTFLGNATSNISSGYTRVIRNENGAGGAPNYAPILHVAASDTMWQIAGAHAGQTTLVWRSGYSGAWNTPWWTIYHSGNFTDNSSNWNTAFGWGNHASAGYLTSGSLSGYATQSYVNSQGFLTSLPSHNHDDRYYTETESDSRYLYYRGYSTSGNTQNFQSTANTIRFDQVGALDNGAWSNQPTGYYTYGGILSLRGESFGLQIYGSHTGDLVFKTQWDNDQYSGWRTVIHSANIGSQSVSYASTAGSAPANGGNSATVGGYSVSVGASANTIPTRNASGYLIPESWIQLNGIYGLYSPTNGAHLRPNDGSYGSWMMTGSRNSWQGIEFNSGNNGNVTLMINVSSNTVGFHNNSYGWQFYWESGALHVLKNSYGGGTDATVLDSSNYSTWAQPIASAINTGNIGSQSVSYASSAGSVAWTNVSSRPTALSQFTNDLGNYGGWQSASTAITTSNIGSQSVSYATTAGNADTVDGYHESDFWRNNQTRTIAVLNFTGVGGDSGNGTHPTNYGIYQQGGAWNHPYPDLCIGYHTGIKIGAFYGYNGTRFYNNSDWATEIFSVGNGDDHVRVANNLYVGGNLALHAGNYNSYSPTLTGTGASGTWGISISGNAATATYATTAGSAPANGGNSATVGGYTPSGSVGANTVVIRDANNYIYANYINSNVSETENPTINSFYTSNGDGWLRKSSVAHVKSQLGLGSMAYESSGTYQTVSGAINTGNIGSQSVSYATISQQLTKFGDIYGQDWNSYFITGKLIVSNALGHTGSNRPSDSYDYGTALSYGETGGPLMQMYFPEDVANTGGSYRALAYRSGYNGSWSAWKTVVNQVGNTCTVAGSNGTGLQVHSNVGYNQNPLTYFLLRGQADSSWKTFKILLTGDAGGQDIEFRRIAENSTDARMFYVPRGLNQVIFDYTVVQPSDSRLKDNLTLITTPVEKIKALSGVEFDWNSGEHVGTHDVGLIAQDVEAVLPEAVTTQEDGYKNLAYNKVIPLLVEAMKEQQTMIEALKAEIELLKNK